MARLEIAAGLRLWLGRSGPAEDALGLYASAGSQAKSNLRSPGATTLVDATETAMSSSKVV